MYICIFKYMYVNIYTISKGEYEFIVRGCANLGRTEFKPYRMEVVY